MIAEITPATSMPNRLLQRTEKLRFRPLSSNLVMCREVEQK